MTRTIDNDTLEAIDLEVDRMRTLLAMAAARLNEDSSDPNVFVYTERILKLHLDEIERLARNDGRTVLVRQMDSTGKATMNIRAIIAGAAVLLHAAGPAAAFETGNDLYAECTRPSEELYCLGYVQGVVGGWNMGVTAASGTVDRATAQKGRLGVCAPEGATKGQALDMVLQYLRDRPKNRDIHAPILVIAAVQQHWPC